MKKTSRHAVDTDLAQEGVERKGELLSDVLNTAIGRAAALSIVLGTARSYAGYLAAAREMNIAELCRALRIGAQAASAIFSLGSGDGDVRFALGGHHAKLPATGPTDATHVGNWRIGWWFALILRDRAAIDRLAATPIDVLRRSSSRGDECQYLFVEALQGYEKREPDWSTKLQAALDATDPTHAKLSDEEFVLNILVPEMQMLFRLALGEIAPFGSALEFALARHKKYWSKGNRKQDPDGFLALGPLAIASVAFDAGIPIEVESEYAPRELIENRYLNV
jgi:hypothetical protein